MSKTILILSDTLRYDAAVESMGYLGHLVESNLASLYKIVGELPSMSRPIMKPSAQAYRPVNMGSLIIPWCDSRQNRMYLKLQKMRAKLP